MVLFSPCFYHVFFSLALSLSLSSFFSCFLWSAEQWERYTKLVGKSRLKLHGTVRRGRILSSGPQGDGRGVETIRSKVSMWWQWQWLQWAFILQAATRLHQHSKADERHDSFPENIPICACLCDCWTSTTVLVFTGCVHRIDRWCTGLSWCSNEDQMICMSGAFWL